jgi:hypothetical protein
MRHVKIVPKRFAAVALLLSVHSLFAADPVPIHWTSTASTVSLPLTKGSKVVAKVTATIAPGWHLYAFEQQPGGPLPTNVSLVTGQQFVPDGKVMESDPKTEYDSNFNLPTSLFEGKAVFTVPAKTVSAVPGAAPRLKIDVAFQTCNDRMCLPLTVVHLTAPIAERKVH